MSTAATALGAGMASWDPVSPAWRDGSGRSLSENTTNLPEMFVDTADLSFDEWAKSQPPPLPSPGSPTGRHTVVVGDEVSRTIDSFFAAAGVDIARTPTPAPSFAASPMMAGSSSPKRTAGGMSPAGEKWFADQISSRLVQPTPVSSSTRSDVFAKGGGLLLLSCCRAPPPPTHTLTHAVASSQSPRMLFKGPTARTVIPWATRSSWSRKPSWKR